MVKGHHDQDILALIFLGGLLHCFQRGVYGRQVIHASGSDELLAGAKDFAASGIGRNQVKGNNILLGDAYLLPTTCKIDASGSPTLKTGCILCWRSGLNSSLR